MAQVTTAFAWDARIMRVVPALAYGQGNMGVVPAAGTPAVAPVVAPFGDTTIQARISAGGVLTITDTCLALLSPGLTSISNVFPQIGRRCDVSVVSNRACEIHLMFGGVPADDTLTMVQNAIAVGNPNYMMEIADYPPMFVPADLTRWTVWRGIEITDRFFFLYVKNLDAGGTINVGRINSKIYDAQL